MLPFFRHSRIYNQLSNHRRQLCAFISTIPIQRKVIHEETRKLSTSKPLSIEFYSAHSKKLFNTANWTSQIYTLQSFSSRPGSSRFHDSRKSERDARTVMVGGLSKDTTEDSLRKYFIEKNMYVTDCEIIRHKHTGISRQFGFVEFATAEQAVNMTTRPHLIDFKEVSVKMKEGKEFDDKYKIFVGGLRKETSRAILHHHFSKFGDIFECSIVRNEDNLSRGFGYVTYKSQDSVNRALNSQPHAIDNKVVDVKQADSRRREFTLFIGKLSPKTTDESLQKHFSKYGQLTQCNVKTDRQTGRSRGFGYVAFGSQEELDHALDGQPHVIDGVEVKINYLTTELDLQVDSLPRNISEETLKKSLWDLFSRYGQGKLVNTHQKGIQFDLIVNGLPKDTTDEDLYETFSQSGKLVHWEVKRDRKNKTNRPLGYGYVSFSTAEEVARAIENQPYYINGTMLRIERKYEIYKEYEK